MKVGNNSVLGRSVALLFLPLSALVAADNRIPLGEGVSVTPTLDITEAYDDNIYKANVAGDTSTWVTSLSPSILLDVLQGLNQYQLSYSATTDFINSLGQDQNTDHHLRASGVFALNRMNRLEVGANYDKVENIANTLVVGANDRFENTSVSATYGFGTPKSPIALDVGVDAAWFRSLNEGVASLGQEYDKAGFKAVGYYLVSPKVRALAEYRHEEFDYLLSSSLLDSDRDIFLVGATWSMTARTVGTVKVGLEDRNFDDAAMEDSDGAYWEANLSWQPGRRDTLVFNTFQGTREGSVEQDYVDTTNYSISWNRQLSPQVTTDLFFSISDEDYENQANRQDDLSNFGARLNYEMNRWLTLGASYQYEDRDSNQPVRSYERNVYLLNLNLSM